jgi:hypothetical protein
LYNSSGRKEEQAKRLVILFVSSKALTPIIHREEAFERSSVEEDLEMDISDVISKTAYESEGIYETGFGKILSSL